MKRRICALVGSCLILLCFLITCPVSIAQGAASELADALAHRNLEAVRASVAGGRKMLGKKAGEPEVADKFLPVPKDARIFLPEEAQRGFAMHFATLEKMCRWRTGVDPTTLTAPLRGPASVIVGNVAAVRAKLDGA